MPHVLATPDSYVGRAFLNSKGNAECVEFIRQTLGAPPTASWTAGTRITKVAAGQADPVAKGTAIATFVNGRYATEGGRHAAIYMGQNEHGIIVLDQWRAQGKVKQRVIRWNVPAGTSRSNDGSAYSVIEW